MKSILFNDEMVRAILDGRKTKTRRPLKPQPDEGRKGSFSCPFGQVGDRLWVREAFCLETLIRTGQDPPFFDGRPIQWWNDGVPCAEEDGRFWIQPHYRATDPYPNLPYSEWESEPIVRWKPSLNMPRWASRITLEITEIRVERVQEIMEKEAKAEGVLPCDGMTAVYWFSEAWDSLYAKKGLGWYANPWVWVITFRRVKG